MSSEDEKKRVSVVLGSMEFGRPGRACEEAPYCFAMLEYFHQQGPNIYQYIAVDIDL